MSNKSKLLINICVIFLIAVFVSCSQSNIPKSDLYPLQKVIVIPQPTEEQKQEFNSEIKSEFVTPSGAGDIEFSGYKTHNKKFLKEVITPIITPHLEELRKKSKADIINTLTLFGYEIYQTYFGRDFYRWGGDILDLDDPQDRSIRYQYAYGLDCSGLAALPYEMAVYFNLIEPEEALFSSKGFEKYCSTNSIQDIGGREGTSNNFRLDTQELAELGHEVLRLEKNQIPTEDQINLLQSGDIVGRSGHFGIIAFLKGEPYYFESGGWVVPMNDGIPVKAIEALKIFASTGSIAVRRSLASNNN